MNSVFSNHSNNSNEIEVAEEDLDAKLLKTIQEELNSSNKSSALDNEQKQQISAKASTQQHNCHTNTKNLIDVTPWMDGSIILSLLQDKDGGRDQQRSMTSDFLDCL